MKEPESVGMARRSSVGICVWILIAGFCAVTGVYSTVSFVRQSIQAELAVEQIKTFSSMETLARDGSERDAGEALQYVIEYYPSGTKQTAGSALDRIVEDARRHAVDEIIAILRIRTGQDFGKDPESWIEYCHRPRPDED